MNGKQTELLIEVRTTEMRCQTTKTGKKLYWQKAGLTDGDNFPVVFNVFRGSPDEHGNAPLPMKVGNHLYTPVFTAGNYGDLQVSAFDSTTRPASPEAVKAAS